MKATSLRVRLLLLIVVPLSVVCAVLAFARFREAQATSAELFDRTLLAATFAIARDVAASEGNTLELPEWDILNDASGGQVYYHVGGPDGAFVVGYATPPVPPTDADWSGEAPLVYDATHLGEPVRAMRLRTEVTNGPVRGFSTVTAWQRVETREAFANDLARTTLSILAAILVSVSAITWFGVNFGLRPLTDLEDAISKRSGDDLQPIRRPVPREISGLVRRLNSLFGQVKDEIHAKDAFISDAAHQLRNPVAGVLAMAQAMQAARMPPEAAQRAEDLVDAARQASHLTVQMLNYERIRSAHKERDGKPVMLAPLLHEVAHRFGPRAGQVRVDADPGLAVLCEADMLGEAVYNLIDNAVVHGTGDTVLVQARSGQDWVEIGVLNDGPQLLPEDLPRAVKRFTQLTANAKQTGGSGLGLSIVQALADAYGGSLTAYPSERGAHVALRLREAPSPSAVAPVRPMTSARMS